MAGVELLLTVFIRCKLLKKSGSLTATCLSIPTFLAYRSSYRRVMKQRTNEKKCTTEFSRLIVLVLFQR